MAQLVIGDNTLTKAQLVALLATTAGDAVAVGLGPIKVRWNRDANNLGIKDGLDVSFDIAETQMLSVDVSLPQSGDTPLTLAALADIPAGNLVTITIPAGFPVEMLVPATITG